MAELLTTTQGSTTTVHPWYQLFKTRVAHINLDKIIMVPNVVINISEEEKKHFAQNGMLTPIVIDQNNLLIDGAKRLKYFKGIAQYALVYKAKNVDEENFLKALNGKCDEKHPDIFDMSFLFEKDMREYTLKVLPLLKEGIKMAPITK